MIIGFWKTEKGHLLSHSKGLTEEQILEIKELVKGDRLIIYQNDKISTQSPDFTMRRFRLKEEIAKTEPAP